MTTREQKLVSVPDSVLIKNSEREALGSSDILSC